MDTLRPWTSTLDASLARPDLNGARSTPLPLFFGMIAPYTVPQPAGPGPRLGGPGPAAAPRSALRAPDLLALALRGPALTQRPASGFTRFATHPHPLALGPTHPPPDRHC